MTADTLPVSLPGLSPAELLGTLTAEDAASGAYRLTVSTDTDAENPADWGGCSVVPLFPAVTGTTSRGDYTVGGGDDPLDLAGALSRFGDGVTPRPGHWANLDGSADAAIRWARIFHGVTVARWRCTPDQSGYVDALVYLTPEDGADWTPEDAARYLEGTVDTLTTWATGNVSVVTLERRPPEDVAEDADTWDTVEDTYPLGGCYLGADYTAAAVAVEHWGAPEAFAAALPVVTTW